MVEDPPDIKKVKWVALHGWSDGRSGGLGGIYRALG